MYIHVFGFRWKPGVTEEQKSRVAWAILDFRGAIDGLEDVQVGRNLSSRGQGYEFVGVMRFIEKGAFEVYTTHPQHQALLDWLMPMVEPVELDFHPIG